MSKRKLNGNMDKLSFIVVEEGECECLSDPDRHMIISIGWKYLQGLAAALVGAASVAKTMEKRICKPMQQ